MKLDQEARGEIQRLGNVVDDRQKKLEEAEKALEDFVRQYMAEHGMWDNPEDITEIISCLPKGYLRFKMYDRYYELKEMQEEPQTEPAMKGPGL